MHLISLKKSIDYKNREIERYRRGINLKSEQIINLQKIVNLYPEAQEVRDYSLSKFSGYKFYVDKSSEDDEYQDILARYSRYSGLTIINCKKILDKHFLVKDNALLHVRKTTKHYGGNYTYNSNYVEEYEVNFDYEKKFKEDIVNKIDKLIIKYNKSGKIKIPKTNISKRLQKLLAFK